MRRLVLLVFVALVGAASSPARAQPTPDHVVPKEAGQVVPLPPRQPEPSGLPHDHGYPFAGEPARFGVSGLGGFTVYEPRDERGAPPADPVPVVVLLRGACVGTCDYDRENDFDHAWREHLVKKGNIVVLPHYQEADEPEFELANVAAALHLSLGALTEPAFVERHPGLAWESDEDADGNRVIDGPHAQPDRGHVGFTGHSRGSQMAVKLAARIATGAPFGAGVHLRAGRTAADLRLPSPAWLLVVQAGPTSFQDYSDAAAIPADTLAAVVVGEDDTLAGEAKGIEIWQALERIPLRNRDFVRVRSHRRNVWMAGPPAPGCELGPAGEVSEQMRWYAAILTCASNGLVWSRIPKPEGTRNMVNPGAQTGDLTADHYFPGRGDALDVYAIWKLSQALIECSGSGRSCAYALGDTPRQRDMGDWSDGAPVNPLCVTNTPTESWLASCMSGSAADGGPDGRGDGGQPASSAGSQAAGPGSAAPPSAAPRRADAPPLPATGGSALLPALVALSATAVLRRRRHH